MIEREAGIWVPRAPRNFLAYSEDDTWPSPPATWHYNEIPATASDWENVLDSPPNLPEEWSHWGTTELR